MRLLAIALSLLAGIAQAQTSFKLTSPVTGLAPFTVGLGFKKGEITTPALSIPDQQVVVMRRWNDGSVKHAIASGQVTLTADTPQTVSVSNGTATGAALTATVPAVSVTFGNYGAATPTTAFRTFVAGPEMVETHYRAQVDATLVAWFYVRQYKSGKVWIRVIGNNGYLDIPNADKTYTATVNIGGQVTTLPITHYAHTRWTKTGWIGGDPQITPQHDTAYLKAAKLVPNYMVNTPDAGTLASLYQTYVPNQAGNWTPSMGNAGFQNQIGLLPKWDALYVTSSADARAYKSVLANAEALNSYPIEWDDSVTKLTPKPSDRPDWSMKGQNVGGVTDWAAGPLKWEIAHHGSGGYLAYLITGDSYFLETMANQAATAYLMIGPTNWQVYPPAPNLGISRLFTQETRAFAWSLRTLGQYTGIAPGNDAIAADYGLLLASNMRFLQTVKNAIGSGIGYLYEYNASLYGPGIVAPWQQHFFIQSLGMGSDLEPLADMSVYNDVRDYMYRGAVGILGDSSGYCFNKASTYTLKSNPGTDGTSNPVTWYKAWAQVYAGTFPTAPPCTNTLDADNSGGPASQGYYGNLMPAIAYAVDHGAAGAAASWARLSTAGNWSTILNSGFNNTPNWGVVPRGTVTPTPAPTPTPVPTGIPPVAAFTLSCPTLTCTFDASTSTGAVTYAWTLGRFPDNDATGKVVSTTYAEPSTRTVVLTVTDSAGQTNSKAQTFVVPTPTPAPAPAPAPTPAPAPIPPPATATTFAAVTVPAGTVATSNAIVRGPKPVSIYISAGGSYSLEGGPFVVVAGSYIPGTKVSVRATAPAAKGVSRTVTLYIAGEAFKFVVTAQ